MLLEDVRESKFNSYPVIGFVISGISRNVEII